MGIRIGVLGGIGPEATGEFYNKLINRLQKKGLIKSNIDFPQIIINSLPAPELIYDQISNEELKPYINGLKELDKFGVDFIVMVCNTIHLFYDELQKEIETPILDLKDELRRLLISKRVKSAFIIGTPNTIKQGLYRFKGTESFEPNKEEMKELTDAIFNFNKGFDKQMQINKVSKICQKYLNKGAKTIILGCTEFAVMLSDEDMPKIDTINVMVDSTIEYSRTKNK
ncbi:aspartate/glutamate racemase family protein [Candidatus Woesearchaeota archaeon]|nr:aspartate/glutamate racemase family protein [Candidatus Woesearchaeota archaeon]